MKIIVNAISISRIFFALYLLRVKPLSSLFYILYVICGLTDVVDGYIARKTNNESKLGERLDSISDLVMVFVVLKILVPIIDLHINFIIWIAVVIAIRCTSLVIVLLKYKTFGILHTLLNKFTGLLLFFYPLTLSFVWSNLFLVFVGFVATLSSIEEMCIHCQSDELYLNKKGLFF